MRGIRGEFDEVLRGVATGVVLRLCGDTIYRQAHRDKRADNERGLAHCYYLARALGSRTRWLLSGRLGRHGAASNRRSLCERLCEEVCACYGPIASVAESGRVPNTRAEPEIDTIVNTVRETVGEVQLELLKHGQ